MTFTDEQDGVRRSVYTNTRCYLVTYKSSGTIQRDAI